MIKRLFVISCLTLTIWSAVNDAVAATSAIQPFSLDKMRVTPNRLEIELPHGERMSFEVKSSIQAGITTIRGKLGDNQLLITTDGKNTFGSITTARTNYRIETIKEGVFIVVQAELHTTPIDISATPAEARVLSEKLKKYRVKYPNGSESQLSSQVDIAIFFTPLLEQQLGVQGVRTKAQFLLDATHQVFVNSGINVALNPVFITRYDDSLGADNDDDAINFAGNNLNGEEASTSRRYGADLMHLFLVEFQTNICGIAGDILWVSDNGDINISEDLVWGMTEIGGRGGCLDEITFPHEIGHNFAAKHDRPSVGGGQNNGYISDYYYGHHCGGSGTIMNVTFSGDRHRFFSSPDIIFEGEPCGVPIGQPDAADNVAVFEVTRSLVENINPPMPVYGAVGFAVDGYVIDDDSSVITVELKRTGDLSKEASIELATLDGSAEADVDFGHFLKRVEFAEGAATAQVEIEILNLQRTTDKDFRLVLRWPFQLEITGSDVIEVKLAKNVITLGQAQFSGTLQSVAENAGVVALTVSRVNGSDGEITVNYQTQDGSAKAGTDYTAASGELVFAEGETSKTISIAILNNSTVDGSRSFSVNLSGNNLGATTSTNVTITDDDQTPQPPVDNGSSGGGGSLGLGLLLLAWLGFLYRVKKKAFRGQMLVLSLPFLSLKSTCIVRSSL